MKKLIVTKIDRDAKTKNGKPYVKISTSEAERKLALCLYFAVPAEVVMGTVLQFDDKAFLDKKGKDSGKEFKGVVYYNIYDGKTMGIVKDESPAVTPPSPSVWAAKDRQRNRAMCLSYAKDLVIALIASNRLPAIKLGEYDEIVKGFARSNEVFLYRNGCRADDPVTEQVGEIPGLEKDYFRNQNENIQNPDDPADEEEAPF